MIGILTNTHALCGNAQDARNLQRAMAPLCAPTEVRLVEPGHWRTMDDVAIVNWHPARVPFSCDMVDHWRSRGVKIIVILQNSFDWRFEVAQGDVLFQVDAVVAHEPMDSNVPIHYIPVGILEMDVLGTPNGQLSVGTAGFCFPWKRVDVVIEAAHRYGCRARIVCPPYSGVDQRTLKRQWGIKLGAGNLDMLCDIRAEEEVVQFLAQNTVNIYWFESQDIHDQLGQSGSARMAVAARRPMVISRHRKFKTMVVYEDDFYVAGTEEEAYQQVGEILEGVSSGGKVKAPSKIFEDQGWSVVAKKYWKLVQEICST